MKKKEYYGQKLPRFWIKKNFWNITKLQFDQIWISKEKYIERMKVKNQLQTFDDSEIHGGSQDINSEGGRVRKSQRKSSESQKPIEK